MDSLMSLKQSEQVSSWRIKKKKSRANTTLAPCILQWWRGQGYSCSCSFITLASRHTPAANRLKNMMPTCTEKYFCHMKFEIAGKLKIRRPAGSRTNKIQITKNKRTVFLLSMSWPASSRLSGTAFMVSSGGYKGATTLL